MTSYHIFAICSITILSLVYYIGQRLEKSHWLWHGKFLSFAGGVSVAYVFIDLLPKLGSGQTAITSQGIFPLIEKHVYLLSLLGLVIFYSIEQLNQSTRGLYQTLNPFWLSMLTYGTFNFLIGYAISDRHDPDIQPLSLFTVAMALHFFINDHNLYKTHENAYDQIGRTLMVASLLLGFFIGLSTSLSDSAIALVVAFISGGMIMNVFQHELPAGYRPHTSKPFALGAFVYTLILIFLD